MNTTTGNSIADNQHAAMVEAILRTGGTHTSAVEQALRTVPRHAFLPGATLDQAYDPDLAVITKRAADGSALSCASVPTLVASMLEQLQVRPGDRIFECGAGTGYNAALLARLAGPDGTVTTVDIDAEIAARAADALRQAGYPQVRILTGDGAAGVSRDAPFTRAIITVGAWDLPPAWWDQLAAPAGRLVVPLRWRGQTRAVAFVHDGYGVMRSDSVQLCGFVPMIGQDGEKTATIDPAGQVSLYWDADQHITPSLLAGALTTSRREAWSQATVGPYDPFDGIWLRATATDPAVCRIAATKAAIDSGLCTPAIASRSPALAEDNSLAYLTYTRLRQGTPPRQSRLGAIGHGPRAQELAERLCRHIHAWDNDRDAQPNITARRHGTAPHDLAATTITKKHCTITVTY